MKTHKGKGECAIHEGITVSGDRAPVTLNLYTRLGCVVSFLYIAAPLPPQRHFLIHIE
jgi:hypothetical protein